MQEAGFLLSVVLPVLCLAVGAWLLPRVFVGRRETSRRRITGAVILSAVLLLLGGALLFAGLYAIGGLDVGALVAASATGATLFFVQKSLLAGLVWGPILLIKWLSLGTRAEAYRSEDGISGP